MGLFSKRAPEPPVPAWAPNVDLTVARPAIFALAQAPASTDWQVRSAIAEFVRLSQRPSLERALNLIQRDPDVLNRPWIWLVAAMQKGSADGDHHVAVAGLYWACYWTSNLVPRNDLGGFIDLELDPIPVPNKKEILQAGLEAAGHLPSDFIVVGDETGQLPAGLIADTAQTMLGL